MNQDRFPVIHYCYPQLQSASTSAILVLKGASLTTGPPEENSLTLVESRYHSQVATNSGKINFNPASAK